MIHLFGFHSNQEKQMAIKHSIAMVISLGMILPYETQHEQNPMSMDAMQPAAITEI